MTQKTEIESGVAEEVDTQVISMFSNSIYFPNPVLEQELFDAMHSGIECGDMGSEKCMSCIGRQVMVFAMKNPEELSTFFSEFREEIDSVFGLNKTDELLRILSQS